MVSEGHDMPFAHLGEEKTSNELQCIVLITVPTSNTVSVAVAISLKCIFIYSHRSFACCDHSTSINHSIPNYKIK